MDEWLTGKQAQTRLQRSERQVRNYAASGDLRTRRVSGRVQYHAGDVETLAERLRPQVEPVQDVMPPGQLLDHIRDLETRLQQASAEVGYLRGLLEGQRLEIEEAKETRKLIATREAETQALQHELSRLDSGRKSREFVNVALIVLVLIAFGVIIYLVVYR